MNKLSALTEDELSGRTVFVRGGLNAPVTDGEVVTDFRLRSVLPTLKLLQQAGAKTVLVGHLSGSDTDSFQVIYEYLKQKVQLTFVRDFADGNAQEAIDSMSNGDLILLENLRQHAGEKANDKVFARMLADYADVYVNEAFPAAHRKHASIVGVPQHLPAYAGLQFEEEVTYLSQTFDPEHPFVFVLGGAKFSTKIPLIEKFTSLADDVFVGGAIANAYLQAQGHEVGQSRLPDKDISIDADLHSDTLHLPKTVVCENVKGKQTTKPVTKIDEDETIVDVGQEFSEQIISKAEDAEMTVWNGPMGWYEKGYTQATDELANDLVSSSGQTILGGGDTAAVVLDEHSAEDFSFLSTAGGAMIDFLANETLPGIEALRG